MQLSTTRRKSKKREGRSRKGEGSVYQRGGTGTYYYKIPDPKSKGQFLTGPCNTDDYDSAILFKTRKLVDAHDAQPKPTGQTTLNEVLDEYTKYCEKECPRSWRSLRTAIKHLRAAFGRIKADELTTADTDQFRDDRLFDGVIDPTVNRELGYLKAAMRQEMERTPPRVTRIPFMRIPSEKDRVRDGFIERIDYTLLREKMPRSLDAIFVCGFHIGARLGELKAIQWPSVNFSADIIELRPKTTKNSDGRWIPIWGDMRAALLQQKAIRDQYFPTCPWVFFWMNDHHPRSVPGEPLRDFRWAWEKACTEAGFPNLLFHDLRRSAVKYAYGTEKVPPHEVMQMSGHKTDAMLRRYNILGISDAKKTGRKLNESLKTQSAGSV